jgi:cyclopropane fatty-acyl-phospholipid synthase-like methyltransferase
MNTQTTSVAQDNPYGIYSPDSIRYFSSSDERNKLYRELAYQDLVKRFQLKGKLLDLGAGCGGTSIVWKNLGFDVIASDLHPFFVDHMKSLGLNTAIVDATNIQDSLGTSTFDVVFASGLTPQVRRVYENAVKTYESIGNVLNKGGFFIFDFTIARTDEYKKTFYNPQEIIQIINSFSYFKLVDTHKTKACPAYFYRHWNKYLLFSVDRLISPIVGLVQRYVIEKV